MEGILWNGLNQVRMTLFVTLNSPPLALAIKLRLFQTVLYYACSNSGATTAVSAVANTWSLFTSSGTGPANIKAMEVPTDKSKYEYWTAILLRCEPWLRRLTALSTTALLAATDGDGECYSFGQLFQDALWANGISNTGIIITPTVSGLSFLVKDSTPSIDRFFASRCTFLVENDFQRLGGRNAAAAEHSHDLRNVW